MHPWCAFFLPLFHTTQYQHKLVSLVYSRTGACVGPIGLETWTRKPSKPCDALAYDGNCQTNTVFEKNAALVWYKPSGCSPVSSAAAGTSSSVVPKPSSNFTALPDLGSGALSAVSPSTAKKHINSHYLRKNFIQWTLLRIFEYYYLVDLDLQTLLLHRPPEVLSRPLPFPRDSVDHFGWNLDAPHFHQSQSRWTVQDYNTTC